MILTAKVANAAAEAAIREAVEDAKKQAHEASHRICSKIMEAAEHGKFALTLEIIQYYKTDKVNCFDEFKKELQAIFEEADYIFTFATNRHIRLLW